MSKILEFKFDADQAHQKRAIESVLGILEGYPKINRSFTLSDECVPNLLPDSLLEEEFLFNNVKIIQESNGLSTSAILNVDQGFAFDIQNKIESWSYPSFTIEMETGTGKTYAYLRTMFELHQKCGFGKFIVVVPSVAIYEGVIKAIEITKQHFATLYHNEYLNLIEYDGSQLGKLREFSHSQFLTVMVMTMAAFNKTSNNIYKPTEKLMGEKLPFEYIQEVRPILMLDECQNYGTDTAKQALRTLHPLFALKYSATAGVKDDDGIWQYDNLIFQLDPLEAFRRNLVKRIQIYGVTEASNANRRSHLRIIDLLPGPKVKLEAVVVDRMGRRDLGQVTLKGSEDLKAKSKNADYEGFVVENIDLTSGAVEFENGEKIEIKTDEQEAKEKKEIFKEQIANTVRQHMELQTELADRGIKVLSLFFIDRVSNYRGDNGLIRILFEEIFNETKKGYPLFKGKSANKVHDGYFAQKQTKEGVVEIDTEGGKNDEEREAEKRAFELIMRRKEQLLSFDEEVSFIFAHSALKEGWDNPNVFQICTLATRYSERRKRQEIGRGMRLCVNQAGDRVLDPKVNVLTVIPNESYENFVTGLQSEYRETGNALPPAPSNAKRDPAKRNNTVFKKREFAEFWAKLIQETDYKINIDTNEVINNVISNFSKKIIDPPQIVVKKGAYVFSRYEITADEIQANKAKIKISKRGADGEDKDLSISIKAKSDLAKEMNDKALEGFVVAEIGNNRIHFSNDQVLSAESGISFDAQKLEALKSARWEKDVTFPVFNLIDRTAYETMLTRKTVIEIFGKVSEDKRKTIFQNPEGFATAFISTIKTALTDHVARNIEYVLTGGSEKYNLDEIFPKQEQHPQRDLTKGSDASLYDLVQYESGVEFNFLQNRLNADKKVILYFKFPDSFKVKLPKIIGNYVPDWGIVREGESGKLNIELVRETKGTTNLNLLQFANEKNKIYCAEKHFNKLGVDYKTVTDEETDWWTAKSETQVHYLKTERAISLGKAAEPPPGKDKQS